ncbi:MAG: hypothetical protein NW207_03020 [Cytophagales bacterium]|nr:hypothetical protein [Cytophagales bacterium]
MIKKIIILLHIEAVLAANAVAYFFVAIHQIEVSIHYFILLSTGTYVLYMADHLMDVRNKDIGQLCERHKLYKIHMRLCASLMAFFIFMGAVFAALFFDINMCICGAVMIILCTIYILNCHKKAIILLPKEIFGAIIFSLSVTLYPVLIVGYISIQHIFWMILISVSVALNLIFFAIISENEDRTAQFQSLITSLGLQYAIRLGIYIYILNICISIFYIYFSNSKDIEYIIIFNIINSIYMAGMHNKNTIKNNEINRILADMLLVLPGILCRLLSI